MPEGVRVNLIDTVRMAADLAAAREGSPDCIAVCIHWGNEYERQANAEQRRLARFLRRNGADLIVGSHPHVVQPFETDSSHVVLYSLGNFVSNQRRRYCDGGLMAEIEAVRHPDGRMTYTLDPVPVWVAMPATGSFRLRSATRWLCRRPIPCSGRTWRRCSIGSISNPNSRIKTNDEDNLANCRGFSYLCCTEINDTH